MLRINKTKLEGEIEVKRFYLNGVEMVSLCPNCREASFWNGDSEYISHPNLDENQYVHFCCDDCEEEWEEYFKMSIVLEPINN